MSRNLGEKMYYVVWEVAANALHSLMSDVGLSPLIPGNPSTKDLIETRRQYVPAWLELPAIETVDLRFLVRIAEDEWATADVRVRLEYLYNCPSYWVPQTIRLSKPTRIPNEPWSVAEIAVMSSREGWLFWPLGSDVDELHNARGVANHFRDLLQWKTRYERRLELREYLQDQLLLQQEWFSSPIEP